MHTVGVVGLGGMGSVHGSKYVQMPDVKLIGCDRDTEKREAYEKRFGVETLDSYEDLLKRCDIIDICLPTDTHLPFGLQAIASGRALLMEKPIAGTVSDAIQLMEAAAKQNVPFMPAQVVRYFPDFRRGHETIRSGALGRVAVARTRRGGPAPMGSGGWFRDISRSGGVLLDLAIHDFDWLRWTLGEVEQVYSRSVALNNPPSGDFQGDYSLTTLTFESGALGHVEGTWMDPGGFRTTFSVFGSAGVLEHDSRQSVAVRTSTGSGTSNESQWAPGDDPYFNEIRGFLDAVQQGVEPPVTGYDGVMAVSIAMAAIESCRTGKATKPIRP